MLKLPKEVALQTLGIRTILHADCVALHAEQHPRRGDWHLESFDLSKLGFDGRIIEGFI